MENYWSKLRTAERHIPRGKEISRKLENMKKTKENQNVELGNWTELDEKFCYYHSLENSPVGSTISLEDTEKKEAVRADEEGRVGAEDQDLEEEL